MKFIPFSFLVLAGFEVVAGSGGSHRLEKIDGRLAEIDKVLKRGFLGMMGQHMMSIASHYKSLDGKDYANRIKDFTSGKCGSYKKSCALGIYRPPAKESAIDSAFTDAMQSVGEIDYRIEPINPGPVNDYFRRLLENFRVDEIVSIAARCSRALREQQLALGDDDMNQKRPVAALLQEKRQLESQRSFLTAFT